MRILITSGGTKIPIDPVRHIANGSRGRFGAELATAALVAGMEVSYLVSRQGDTPFLQTTDYHTQDSWKQHIVEAKRLYRFGRQYQAHYREYHYADFNDYQAQLKRLITTEKPNIIMLAAAVSDYTVGHFSETKMRSSQDLTLHLQLLPKLIHSVKTWHPSAFLVGFKLLVEATDEELIAAAKQSLDQHGADLVIANDLSSIKRGQHNILLIDKTGFLQKVSHQLAETVIYHCLREWHK